MSYLLDANTLIGILNGKPLAVRDRWVAAAAAAADVATSSVVVFELAFGAYKSSRPDENLARLKKLLSSTLQVLEFDLDDAETAGLVRAELRAKGHPIGPFDVLIAGQALRRGLTLVTSNVGEFRRVKGLAAENWAKP